MALKMDFNMWLVIAYFLRPVIVKLAGFRLRGGTVPGAAALKNMLYPNDFSFFIALAAAPILPGSFGSIRINDMFSFQFFISILG